MLSASLADFVKDMTGYRITVSFMAQGIMRTSPIEIDWKGPSETVQARGVESVSSPITNVNVSNEDFENAVIAEFGMMYGFKELMTVTEVAGETPEIAKGLAEMKVSGSCKRFVRIWFLVESLMS